MSDFHSQVLPAIEKALIRDLPDIEYHRRIPGTKAAIGGQYPVEVKLRRPHRGDIQIYVFPQTWSDTSLGFGGVAGQAFTSAYVTVVISDHRAAAVYMGGTLAYVVPVSSDLMGDIARGNMHDVQGAHRHYGRDPRGANHPRENMGASVPTTGSGEDGERETGDQQSSDGPGPNTASEEQAG